MKIFEFQLKLDNESVGIGSDDGLVPNKRQAIIWTNGAEFTDAYIRHSSSMSKRRTSNIRRTISQNLNVSHLVLQLVLPNILKTYFKSRVMMQLVQRRQAMP